MLLGSTLQSRVLCIKDKFRMEVYSQSLIAENGRLFRRGYQE